MAAAEADSDPVAERLPPLLLQPVLRRAHAATLGKRAVLEEDRRRRKRPEGDVRNRGGAMSEEKRPTEGADEVDAHLLRESVGTGLAAAAIFSGSAAAGQYPEPTPPGTADAAAEIALIPKKGDRTAQQTKPQAKKVKKAKKATPGGGGGRHQPQ
jgi:hypothetical protein